MGEAKGARGFIVSPQPQPCACLSPLSAHPCLSHPTSPTQPPPLPPFTPIAFLYRADQSRQRANVARVVEQSEELRELETKLKAAYLNKERHSQLEESAAYAAEEVESWGGEGGDSG